MSNAYAQLNWHTAASQALTTSLAACTLLDTAGKRSDTAGPESGNLSIVPVAASNKITVGPGAYRVDFQMSGAQDQTATDVTAQLNVAGASVADIVSVVAFGASAAKNSIHFTGVIEVTAASDIKVFVKGSQAATFTPTGAQLVVTKLDG